MFKNLFNKVCETVKTGWRKFKIFIKKVLGVSNKNERTALIEEDQKIKCELIKKFGVELRLKNTSTEEEIKLVEELIKKYNLEKNSIISNIEDKSNSDIVYKETLEYLNNLKNNYNKLLDEYKKDYEKGGRYHKDSYNRQKFDDKEKIKNNEEDEKDINEKMDKVMSRSEKDVHIDDILLLNIE